VAARDRYPGFVQGLEERTRIPVPVNRLGILEVAVSEAGVAALAGRGEVLSDREVFELEPRVNALGGVFHPDDGCVDPLLLLDALRMAVARHERVAVVTEDVKEVRVSNDTCEVQTDGEGWCGSEAVVIAAGAWAGAIAGVPSPLPVEPVRGQMVAFSGVPVRHVVYGEGGYIIPKADGTTMAGSTMERVGFDAETTDDGVERVRRTGTGICSALTEVTAYWAGLRPMTPDLLPVLGRDPEFANVIYACGHSRNGVLLAPLTGEVVADLVTGREPRYEIGQFRVGRF
jgi:glycine oxidase